MPPKVTLIIPVYNGKPYLNACIDSVLSQTYENLSCLLIDDGSTDGSFQLLDELAAARPDRLKVVHQKNKGVAAARNLGISLADGAYLMFADNDDIMEPDYVARMVKELEKTGADMLVGGFNRVTEDGKIRFTHRLTKDPWAKFRAVAPWGRIMRLDFVRDNGLRFGSYRLGEDSYFTISSYNASPHIATTDYIGYHWVDRPASVSNTAQKRSDITSALPLLEGLCRNVRPPRHISPELFDYFLIKYVVWHLTFIAGSTAWPLVSRTCEDYYNWLAKEVPDYRRNPQVSPFRPKGEIFGIRLTVWILTKSPMWLKKSILRLYGLLGR
ncbi:MAG: glycosyltransferase family 2 protein [Lachnospiraceae bacterium]|nr:glycosyltransferase family 2 protein [Lachnospiraceae bacterium]